MRLFYQQNESTVFRGAADTVEGKYLNPCVGLCIDGSGSHYADPTDRIADAHSVCSVRYNEFYLTSHVAVLGTSRPCRYTLIYDTIGFKVIQLMCLYLN